jgi:hypothetical protein
MRNVRARGRRPQCRIPSTPNSSDVRGTAPVINTRARYGTFNVTESARRRAVPCGRCRRSARSTRTACSRSRGTPRRSRSHGLTGASPSDIIPISMPVRPSVPRPPSACAASTRPGRSCPIRTPARPMTVPTPPPVRRAPATGRRAGPRSIRRSRRRRGAGRRGARPPPRRGPRRAPCVSRARSRFPARAGPHGPTPCQRPSGTRGWAALIVGAVIVLLLLGAIALGRAAF